MFEYFDEEILNFDEEFWFDSSVVSGIKSDNIDTPKHQGWGRLLTRHCRSKIKHDVIGTESGITQGEGQSRTTVYGKTGCSSF